MSVWGLYAEKENAVGRELKHRVVGVADIVTAVGWFTVTAVVAVVLQPFVLEATTVYTPPLALVALAICGFCRLLEKFAEGRLL